MNSPHTDNIMGEKMEWSIVTSLLCVYVCGVCVYVVCVCMWYVHIPIITFLFPRFPSLSKLSKKAGTHQ